MLSLAILCAFGLFGQQGFRNGKFARVVIDAGHGGYDSGARGAMSKEKDITLAIALKTGELISSHFEEIEVIYTRRTDVFVPLHSRAEIANHSAADLFISIHCNSNPSPRPFGAETYVMGLHKTEENLQVAKAENMAILMEENYNENYDGFNPELDEDYILLNMFQHNSLEHSIHFSSLVQKNLKTNAGLFDRGIKQAGFVVLYLTTMPGVLIETGFLSNPAEEQYLLEAKNQEKIAQAIFEAILEYKSYSDALLESAQISQHHAVSLAENPKVQIYRIAFLKSTKFIPFDAPDFDHLEDVWAFKSDGYYIYTFGSNGNLAEVERLLSEKRKQKGMEKRLKNAVLIPVSVNL